MSGEFVKATMSDATLKAAFVGGSKSGKSFDALQIATDMISELANLNALKGNGRIAVICTENGRVKTHYSRHFDFDCSILYDFSPAGYIRKIDAAVAENYSILIVDQISHEWDGKGGLLEIHSAIAQGTRARGNSWAAWGEATPIHNKFIETLVRCPIHLICTMRAKQEWDQQEENGKKSYVKLAMGPIQRNTTEYEFDLVGDIDQDHVLKTKTRGDLSRILGDRTFMPGKIFPDPGEVGQIGKLISMWLADVEISSETTGFASQPQINEILSLGEHPILHFVPANWQALCKSLKIPSINSLTPQMAEKVKKKLLKDITKKMEEQEVGASQV